MPLSLTDEDLEWMEPAFSWWGVQLACVRACFVHQTSHAEAAQNLGISVEEVEELLDAAAEQVLGNRLKDGLPVSPREHYRELLQVNKGPRRHDPSTPLMAGDRYREGQPANKSVREVVLRSPVVGVDDFVDEDWRGGVPSRHPLDNVVILPGERPKEESPQRFIEELERAGKER